MKPQKGSSPCELVHREGPDLSSLGDERLCHLEISHHVPWRIDILKVKEGYEALIAAFPNRIDETTTLSAPARSYITRLPREAEGRLRYELGRHLPSPLLSLIPKELFLHAQR